MIIRELILEVGQLKERVTYLERGSSPAAATITRTAFLAGYRSRKLRKLGKSI